VAARSEAWVCGRFVAGIAGSNLAGAWMSLGSVLCCQVEASATGRSLVQRSLTECSVSVISKRQQWGSFGPRMAVEPWKKNIWQTSLVTCCRLAYLIDAIHSVDGPCTWWRSSGINKEFFFIVVLWILITSRFLSPTNAHFH